VLRAFCYVGRSSDPLEAEIEVLTSLRAEFGRLPLPIYQHCLELYRRRLFSLSMVFEPVISLAEDAGMIKVSSWEALARTSRTARTAPSDLLNVAHTWGDQFLIERDSVLAATAIRSYADAHASGPWRDVGPRPISINVAVRSILSNTYIRNLRQALEEARLGPRMITLEISERDSIAPRPDEEWLPNPTGYFQARLAKLAHELFINFAVDDFGVGCASLDRISSLGITQIKVDSAILKHPLALTELSLVVSVAWDAMLKGNASSPREVVLEGFDGTSDVSLRSIFDTGIHFIQGYIDTDPQLAIEPASSELRPLPTRLREHIASLLDRGNNPANLPPPRRNTGGVEQQL